MISGIYGIDKQMYFIDDKEGLVYGKTLEAFKGKLKNGKNRTEYILECIQDGKSYPNEHLSLAFQYTLVNEKFDLLDQLISNNCDIHTNNDIALITASIFGHLKYVKLFFDKENIIHNEWALKAAIWNQQAEVVKFFLDNGVWNDEFVQLSINLGVPSIMNIFINLDKDYINKSYKAFEHLSKFGRTDSIEFLLNNGADIHYNEDMLIRYAAFFEHPDLVKVLVEKGVNININESVQEYVENLV